MCIIIHWLADLEFITKYLKIQVQYSAISQMSTFEMCILLQYCARRDQQVFERYFMEFIL